MNTNTENDQVKDAFVCEGPDCAKPHHGQKRIGTIYATALTGFVAGALIALIVLYPWLDFLGKLCPVNGQQ